MVKTTVVVPLYNHEKFAIESIDSILSQTVQDFEIIIIDDHSTDESYNVIQQYQGNKKVTILQNNYNSGINASINRAVEMAQGQYIIYIASDDILYNNHIEKTTTYLDNHNECGVVYCSLEIIDENSNFTGEKINIPQKSRFDVLNQMFFKGNPLGSPGMVVRTDIMKQICPLSISICNHQDAVMHILILLQSECHVINEAFIKYRRTSYGSNISANTNITHARVNIEESLLMDTYLKIDNIDLLINIFPKEIKKFQYIAKDVIPYILGNIALQSKNIHKRKWGYLTLCHFLQKKQNFDLVQVKYQYTFKNLISNANVLIDDKQIHYKKYKKYKKYFRISMILYVTLVIIYLISR